MKIFFITTKLNFKDGGGTIVEFDLMIRGLQELGNDVTVVTAFSQYNKILGPLPYKVIEKNFGSSKQLDIQIGIFRMLREFNGQADWVYIDGQTFLYGAGLYRLLGGRCLVSAYFNRELTCWPDGEANFAGQNKNFLVRFKKFLRYNIEKYIGMFLARRLDVVLFTNPHLQKTYEDFGLTIKPQHVLIFGDPVDHRKNMNELGITEQTYRQRNNTLGPIRVFYSSRMVPGKGFELLITAFSKIKNKGNFKLVLGGSGPEEPAIKTLISQLGLEPYVDLFGWTRDGLHEKLKTADIFIQPRWRRDLTSMSLIDAMAFGLPSILPGGGGLQWDARDSAIYFKDNDPDDLAQKIEQLGNDAGLRAKLSAAGYVRLFDDEMNHTKQIARWNRLMSEVVEKNNRS